MNTKKIELSVGLFVLAGLIAVAVFAISVSGGQLPLPGGGIL